MTSETLDRRFVAGLDRLRALPPLLARATLAAAFITSARGKFSDLEGTAEFFGKLGIPAARLQAPFVAATELVCGSLLGLGLLTRFAALPLLPVMGVAILTARKKEIHSLADLTGIFEVGYILLLGYLVTNGGGAIALDPIARRVIEKRRERAPIGLRRAA